MHGATFLLLLAPTSDLLLPGRAKSGPAVQELVPHKTTPRVPCPILNNTFFHWKFHDKYAISVSYLSPRKEAQNFQHV